MKKYTIIALLAATAATAASPLEYVGHRGSAWGVENTEEAFLNGVKQGYGWLETDVRVSSDRRFVLCHDEDTRRLGGNRVVAESTLDQLRADTLRQTRLGKPYTARLATLAEFLDICRQGGVRPVIELKWGTGVNSKDCSNVPALMAEIDSLGFTRECVILTSMKPVLEYIHANYPDVKLQFLGGAKWHDSFAWCDSLRMDVDIAHTALTATAVDSLHNIGLKVNCWTVDKPERAAELIEYGVDMITTNSLPVSK